MHGQANITQWNIYMLIKYIKSVLWRLAKCLSYIEDARCLKVNWGNACYYPIQNCLSYNFLSNDIKIKIYRTVIFSCFLYGCETWSLTLRKEHRLKVNVRNRMLRNIFELKRDEATGKRRRSVIKYIRMRCAGRIARMKWQGVQIRFGWGNMRVRDPLEDLGVEGRIKLKRILDK